MRLAVIGRGPIGAAAARHLAENGHDVVLIGPDEPADKAAHRGVFASHYDAGRITRSLDPDGYWADVSRASISRYAGLEAASGLRFFTECGALLAGVSGSDWLTGVEQVRDSRRIAADRMQPGELAEKFPYFRFSGDTEGFYEARGAGHVDPRAMVLAQEIAVRQAGGTILQATATGLRETRRGIVVSTDRGDIAADRALLAAGAYSNSLLGTALPLTVYARTVALIEMDPAAAARLAAMPSLVLRRADGRDPYLLPPIRYPDGTTCLKIGGDPDDTVIEGNEIGDWFRSGGSKRVGAFLVDLAQEILPGLDISSVRTEACVTTFSPDDRPVIGPVADRIAVATAGCGRAAKCADELGRLGAEAVLNLPTVACSK